MITKFQLRDFKGHRDTTLDLGRLTVFVGDNGSGKSSALEALSLLSALNENPISVLRGHWYPPDLLRRGSAGPIQLAAVGMRTVPVETNLELQIVAAPEPPENTTYRATLTGAIGTESYTTNAHGNEGSGGGQNNGWEKIRASFGTATLYRLRADRIAAAAQIDHAGAGVAPDGANTPVALSAMKLANDEAFERVEDSMRKLIPALQRVRIHLDTGTRTRSQPAVARLAFDFQGAANVPGHGASHGTLISLALLAVLHGQLRPDMILLDEFDHALHPRAQMELARLLRSLLELEEFRDVQIVATTHSPYVLDALDISNVHAFAVGDDGTVASKRLSEHPRAIKMKGALSNGQLWSLDAERKWVLSG